MVEGFPQIITNNRSALTFLGVSADIIGIKPSFAFNLIAIVNASSAIGRLASGALAVPFGAVNIMAIFTTLAGVFTYVWGYVTSKVAFTVVVVLYGCVTETKLPLNADIEAKYVHVGYRQGPLSASFPSPWPSSGRRTT